MRLLSLAGLLLQLGAVCGQKVFTLEQIEDQIEAFLESNATITERSGLPSGCTLACGFLTSIKSSQVAYPDDSEYRLQESHYWSQQQALTSPSCRYSPASAFDVSLAVLTFRATNCQFAVKSGGHAAFAGASNIEAGVTIDLANLNQLTLSSDKTQTAIGTGNVWYDVYTYLQPKGVTVIGGRIAAIGTGGLTTGGGISFFSNRYGWACDNVNNYQVVFADGTIRDVNYKSTYSDLYWALRGGGNNFGIVTRLDLATYPLTDLWAGQNLYLYSDSVATAANNAFYNFAVNSPSDPYGQVILAYAYSTQLNGYAILVDIQYGKPVVNPPIYKNFTSIPGPIYSSFSNINLPDLTVRFNNSVPGGFRQTFWTYTFKNNAAFIAQSAQIFTQEIEKIKDANGINPSIAYQPITTEMMAQFSKNGGNPLGLAGGQTPLTVVNIVISWSDKADDARILAAAQAMTDRAVAAAKAKGLDHPFLYQNYAALQQKVFPSYGAANMAKLKSISNKYDPQQVWQKLTPGYFKLN